MCLLSRAAEQRRTLHHLRQGHRATKQQQRFTFLSVLEREGESDREEMLNKDEAETNEEKVVVLN